MDGKFQYDTMELVCVVLECIIGLLATVLNVLLLRALWRYRRLRTQTTFIVSSLGAAGLCAGVVIPVLTSLPPVGIPREFYSCLLVVSLVAGLYNVNILSFTYVVVDRYCHILLPVKYLRWTTNKKVCGVVACLWLLGFLLGTLPVMWWTPDSRNFSACSWSAFINNNRRVVYAHFLGFVVPVIALLSYMFAHVFRAIRISNTRQRKRSESTVLANTTRGSSMALHHKETFLFRRLAAIFVLLVLSSLPYNLFAAVRLWGPYDATAADPEITLVLLALSHIIAVVAPLVYTYNRRDFSLILTSVWPRAHSISLQSSLHHNISYNVPMPRPLPKGPTCGYDEDLWQANSCWGSFSSYTRYKGANEPNSRSSHIIASEM